MLTGIVTILIMLLFCFQSGEIVPLFVRNQVASCRLLGSKFEWESPGKGWRDGSFLMCVKKDTVRGY